MPDQTFSPPTALPLQIFMVPGSHFDLGWVLNSDGSLTLGDHIIHDAIALIRNKHPEFRFTVEYVLFLRHFIETFPEARQVVREMLHDGRLEACASMTGEMEQILDGETLIRQYTHGIRWLEKTFDYTPVCAQHTDLPGHTIQMPQILAKCGIPYVTYSRYRPPCPLHWWVAPDGSKVLACNHVHHYEWGRIFRPSLQSAEKELLGYLDGKFPRTWPARQVLMPEERDLDWAEPEVCDHVQQWNAKHRELAEIRFAILREFFQALDTDRLPTYGGEAPYGFYSIPAFEPRTYQQCRIAEHALAAAEKFAATRRIEGLGAIPMQRLWTAWEELFWAHDHNIAGQDGPINDAIRTHRAERARVEAQGILREIETSYLIHAKTDSEHGKPILVFNPLSWRRDGLCDVLMELAGPVIDAVEVLDADGNAVPTQMLSIERADQERIDYQLDDADAAEFQARVAFVAKDVPATGYKTFYIRKTLSVQEPKTKATSERLENGFWKVKLKDGRVTKLTCKRTKRTVNADVTPGFFSLVAVEDLRGDLEDGYDPWDGRENAPNYTGRAWAYQVNPAGVTIAEHGPARTRLRIPSKLLGGDVIQVIELSDTSPNITFRVAINWLGHKNRQVRLLFPFSLHAPKATYETPFGRVVFGQDEMPNTYRGEGTRWVQKWLDLSEPTFGLTLSAGCCAINFNGSYVAPLLVQTTYCRGDAYYWTTNRGWHEFAFSLQSHGGDAIATRAFHVGWEQWAPFRVARIQPRCVSVPGKTVLPDRREYIRCDHPAVVVTAFKESDDGAAHILRLFNVSGQRVQTDLTLGFAIQQASMCDMTETVTGTARCDGNKLNLDLGPHEIATYRLALGHAGA